MTADDEQEWHDAQHQAATDLLREFMPPGVASWAVTCIAAPFQVEGLLNDGRAFYYRDRHRRARLGVGPTPEAAVEHAMSDDGWWREVPEAFYSPSILRELLREGLGAS